MKDVLMFIVTIIALPVMVYLLSDHFGSRIAFENTKDKGGLSTTRAPKKNADGKVEMYITSPTVEHAYSVFYGVLINWLYGAKLSAMVVNKIANPTMASVVAFIIELLVISVVSMAVCILGLKMKKRAVMSMEKLLVDNEYQVERVLGSSITAKLKLEP